MPYKTGTWGKQAKRRSKRRLNYFNEYASKDKEKPHRKCIGTFGESFAVKIMPGSLLDTKATHDVLWQNRKIEVKISRIRGYTKTKGWRFRLAKEQLECAEFYLLICLNEIDIIENIYFIPNREIITRNIWITNNIKNKYNKFRIEVKYGR